MDVDTIHGVHENNPTIEKAVKEVRISNSELDTEQRCDFRAYLQHGEELQRKDLGEALERGLFGHKVEETYWNARLQGLNHSDAKQEMYKFMVPETLRIKNPAITGVYEQIEAGFEWFNKMGYRPIETETRHMSYLPGVHHHPEYGLYSLTFCWTPDVVLEGTKIDHDRGDLVIVDNKFTGSFWSDKQIQMYQQLPKYRYFWNNYENMGHVSRTLLMQFNTRANKSASANLFLPRFIPANKHKEERFAEENLNLMLKFAEKKLMDLATWKKQATRTINSKECSWCPFSDDLCPQLLEGSPVATTLKAHYKKNEYGYHIEAS